ncbi:hypothetical protein [Fischerella sp. FACHB-380]|uniref:hypothetical protein n=1 Tax=Fischerella sp. FACHB-380 TaxID=2692799 RepID=UPI0016821D80|nr:hypothetical protein [Fischerella sp. FACHB-380]MBD2431130.1 hypothetical protein [Fischerella sp. FACHB-380]
MTYSSHSTLTLSRYASTHFLHLLTLLTLPISPSPHLPISPLPLIPNARCFMPGNPSTALAPPCRSWGPVSSPSPHLG